MPQLDWSVRIVSTPGGGAGFKPDLGPDSKVGDTLQAQVKDIVTWGNETDDTYQPVALTVNGTPIQPPATDATSKYYFTDPIAPGGSSSRQWVVVGSVGDVIGYACSLHPDVTGTITVVKNFT